MTRTCPIAVLALLTPLASPQNTPRNVVDFEALTPGRGPVTRTLAGDFTEDWEPDVVLLDGGVPKITYASYLFDAAAPVEPSLTSVADIAALRGLSAEGTDVLLATDARGLLALTFDVPTATFSPPVVLAAGDWVDAAPIVSALDPSGFEVIFGIKGTKTLISLVRVGAVFVAGPTFDAVNDVLEFVALDWDADGRLELVFRHALGLEVCEVDGTPIRDLPGPDLGTIAVVTNGTGVDYLAWAKRTLPDTYYELELLNEATWNAPIVDIDLRVPKKPGIVGSPILDLDVRSMAAGDLDGGGPDLVLSHATNQSVYVLRDRNAGAGIDYDALNAVQRFGLSSSPFQVAGPDVAPAAVLQLNNANSLDLAVVTNEDRELRVYVDVDLIPKVITPWGGQGTRGRTTGSSAGTGTESGARMGTGTGGTTQNLGIPQGIIGASHDIFGPSPDDFYLDLNLEEAPHATHLQIVLWEQLEGMGEPVDLQENTAFPLGFCTGSTLHTALVSIAQSLGQTSPRPYYFFQYRLVTMSVDKILSAGESRVGVCALEVFLGEFSGGQLTVPFLEHNLGALGPLPVARGEYTCSSGPDGGAILGVVYSDSLPPLPPSGSIPNPGNWEVSLIETVNH